MKKLTVTAAAVLIVALAALAYGQMGGHGMGSGMMGGQGMGSGMMCGCDMGSRMTGDENPMWGHLTSLNLDEQQKTSIREIKGRTMKDMIKRMADMRIAHIELKDLLGKDPVDMKAVESKVKQAEMMKTEMHLSHIKAMEEVKAKLTPEQRKKFKEMFEAGSMMGGMMMHDQGRCVTNE